MKNTLLTAAVATLFALSGCTDSTKTSGGPGGKDKDKANTTTAKRAENAVTQADDSFSLSLSNITVKQGETKKDTISIKRGKNFDQDVAVKFDKMPEGVTIDPAAPTIKKGDDKVEVSVKATDAAAIGSFDVKVTGHPAKGEDSNNTLKVTVEKK